MLSMKEVQKSNKLDLFNFSSGDIHHKSINCILHVTLIQAMFHCNGDVSLSGILNLEPGTGNSACDEKKSTLQNYYFFLRLSLNTN